MPAPVRIGTTSIVSSRNSIRIATKPTVTVTALVRMPLERRRAPLPFEIRARRAARASLNWN